MVEQGRLEDLMRDMGQGDGAAVFALYEEFGGRIAGAVRAMLRRRGVRSVSADDLDGLVVDACLALQDVAAAWRPDGGALPWRWAHQRIEAVVGSFVGQHADEVDDAVMARLARLGAVVPGPVEEPDLLALLSRLVPAGAMAVLVREALHRSGSERDQRLLLEVKVQEALGDRSPANSVAPLFGMRPAAVRQQVHRVKQRMRDLAAADPRFAPLAALPLVA